MAIVRAALGTVFTGTSTATTSLAKPAGVANGDVLVAGFTVNTSVTAGISAPTGWVSLLAETINNGLVRAFYKVITNAGTEPATYGFTFTSTGIPVNAVIARYSGVDNATPVDAAALTSTFTNNSAPTSPSITTVTAGAYLVGLLATISLTTATSSIWSVIYGRPDGSNCEAMGDLLTTTSGAQGTKAWTLGAKVAGITATMALRPASTAAAVIPGLTMAPLTH